MPQGPTYFRRTVLVFSIQQYTLIYDYAQISSSRHAVASVHIHAAIDCAFKLLVIIPEEGGTFSLMRALSVARAAAPLI